MTPYSVSNINNVQLVLYSNAADDNELKIAEAEYESNAWREEDAEHLPDWLVCKVFKDHCETMSWIGWPHNWDVSQAISPIQFIINNLW
ncbi:hypothetical protein T4A_2746 [Trichinella pseudospiralis]|uniref:Uncharacterized protein n=1 Tax=Trichinella pseudospiralis TaxID=6337 RepID=A0A0V1K754_TRIPS|nr:hypothetical protein T4A_2746 [Trichinella pseudospiralis]KRZ43060.1 hypothetical protein T4C_11265 [Trichinella pseudospiralis]